jgi:hypothetical protein
MHPSANVFPWLTRSTVTVAFVTALNLHSTATGTHTLFACALVTATAPPCSVYVVDHAPPAIAPAAISPNATIAIDLFMEVIKAE